MEYRMAEIGAYEAKTHLPKLLERVEKGERFVITRHGRPVAELVPVGVRDAARVRAALMELRTMRKKFAKRGLELKSILGETESVRDLSHEGHRY
jgi:prevent-host-death family protein